MTGTRAHTPEVHASQDVPPKHGPDAAPTAPAHAHRRPDPAQGKEGTPTRGEGAIPTEGAAENTASTPSPPGNDPSRSEHHHTGTRRGRGHGRDTQN